MLVLGVIILTALLAVSVWNGITLLRIKQLNSSGQSPMADERYFELKFKNQFLVAMFSVFIVIAALLGYNTMEDAKKDIKAELLPEVDSLKKLLSQSEATLEKQKLVINNLGTDMINLSGNVPRLKEGFSQIELLERKVKSMNEKNILKQNYYIVDSLSFVSVSDGTIGQPGATVFKFNSLKTNFGDKLPVFKSPPLIITVPDEDVIAIVYNITKDSFTVAPSGMQMTDRFPWDGKPITFSILIIEK